MDFCGQNVPCIFSFPKNNNKKDRERKIERIKKPISNSLLTNIQKTDSMLDKVI